jgi:hypothetical protein
MIINTTRHFGGKFADVIDQAGSSLCHGPEE